MLSVEIMDSIAQWMEALSALPKLCNSWHLQEAVAAIPIGANVRLSLVSPSSAIKISLLHFIIRGLICPVRLHSVKKHKLSVGRLFPLSASMCLTAKVHQNLSKTMFQSFILNKA